MRQLYQKAAVLQFALASCVFLLLPTSANATEVILSFQDTQPKYFIQDDTLSGLCFDIYKAIEDRVKNKGITFKYPTEYLPLKRTFSEMKNGSIHMYCGAGRNNKRTKLLEYSDVPLYEVKTLIVSRADDISAANSVQDLVKSRSPVMAFLGTSTERFLRKQNVLIEQISLKSISQALRLVHLKRARYFVYHDVGLRYHIAKNYPKDTFKFGETPARSYFHWMIFSKHMDQKTLSHIKQAINGMVKIGEIRTMRKKYE